MLKKQSVIELFDESEISKYRRLFFETIDEIKNDYFNEISTREFTESYINFESVVMKAIGYRFYLKILNDSFFDQVSEKVKYVNKENNSEYLRHPIFYTRIAYPEKNISDLSLLSSQPHYDRSYDLYAYTLWLALENIDMETGGLCFFNNNEQVDKFFKVKWGEKNKYNFDLYEANHNEIDPLIHDKIIHPKLNAGQAYLFDSNILHCGTRSKSKNRVSFDFRFVNKKALEKTDVKTKTLFDLFSNKPHEILSKNLFLIGDYIAANKINSNVESSLPYELVNSKLDIKIPNQKLSWRFENSFI